jgi:uncharacterized DUF497 family protein
MARHGFEWDESKRRKVLEERGIDFIDVARILLGPVVEHASDRGSERRYVAIGPGERQTLMAIVYTIRGDNIRIITARPARKNERRAYLQRFPSSADEGEE